MYSTKLNNIQLKYTNIFYTDGSVNSEGKVGAAFFSPNLSINFLFHLPTGLSIYYAEAFAILKALDHTQINNLNNFCIISDSLSVLTDIKTSNTNSSPHPHIITKICDILLNLSTQYNISLVWFPGHKGNQDSSTIDSLAKKARKADMIHEIEFSTSEALLMLEEWYTSTWYKKMGK